MVPALPSLSRRLRLLALAALLSPLAACHAPSSGIVGTAHATAPSAAKGSFAGSDGQALVAGRALQARAGQLTLDGQSYGEVDDRSVAQLLVRNGQPTVTVNGRVRLPETN